MQKQMRPIDSCLYGEPEKAGFGCSRGEGTPYTVSPVWQEPEEMQSCYVPWLIPSLPTLLCIFPLFRTVPYPCPLFLVLTPLHLCALSLSHLTGGTCTFHLFLGVYPGFFFFFLLRLQFLWKKILKKILTDCVRLPSDIWICVCMDMNTTGHSQATLKVSSVFRAIQLL